MRAVCFWKGGTLGAPCVGGVQMVFEEKFKKPEGLITLIGHRGGHVVNGRVVGGEEIGRREIHNLIVDRASQLMAGRMAPGAITGGSEQAFIGNYLDRGIQYLAVGFGILKDPDLPYDAVSNPVDTSQYDLQNPPVETLADTKLLGEAIRVPPTTWCFVDAAGQETDEITNILKITFTLYEDMACGPITEVGMVGGNARAWEAGAGKDSGYMFNLKRFPVWNKLLNTRLSVCWKLTF